MLGVPDFAKPTWISRLAGSTLVHQAIKTLKLQSVARAVLKVKPIERKAKDGGVRYRVGFLESFLMADEIFQREIYREAFEGKPVRTFIDAGCNAGYFVCYAASQANGGKMTGIAVDGNRDMVSETRWHVDRNTLSDVKVVYGAAGFAADVNEVTFYVNPSNVASSAQPVLNPDVPSKGDSNAVTVPAVHMYEEWKRHAGDAKVDLLKLDVEGSECDFITNEKELLAITDRVVLEWHKWVNELDKVQKLMEEAGFTLRKVISEDAHCGVALFQKTAS